MNIEIPRALRERFESPEWGAEQLENIAILRGFSPAELKSLYSKGEIVSLAPESHAVIEGDPSRGLYIILSGSVSVWKNDATSGQMYRLAHLEEGGNFGELSLFTEGSRSATVSADTICHLFKLDADKFEQFLSESGADASVRFFRQCAIELCERFRVLNADYITSQQLLWKYALRRSDYEENGDVTTTAPKSEPAPVNKDRIQGPVMAPIAGFSPQTAPLNENPIVDSQPPSVSGDSPRDNQEESDDIGFKIDLAGS